MAKLRSFWNALRSIARRLPKTPPIVACPFVFFYSILLILLSYPLGVSSVSDRISVSGVVKEVGYSSAPNWTWAYILIFPCLLFFLLEAFNCVPEILHTLGRRNMLVDDSLIPVSADVAINEWNETLETANTTLALLLVLAIVEPLIEWFSTSAWPLIWCGISCVPENEYDWSVGAALNSASLVWKIANALFSLCVFAQQSFTIAAYAYLLALTFLICVFFNKRRPGWQIVPDRDKEHKDAGNHRGFEVFEGLITNLLVTGLLAMGIFYLSILQNYYLRTHFSDIGEFFARDVVAATTTMLGWDKGGPALLGTHPSNMTNAADFSVSQVRYGDLVVLLFVLGLPAWILRGLAKRGVRALGWTEDINFWPLSYLSLNTYLGICLLVGFSLVFYRAGLWVIGLTFAAAVFRMVRIVYRKVERPKNEPTDVAPKAGPTYNYYGDVTNNMRDQYTDFVAGAVGPKSVANNTNIQVWKNAASQLDLPALAGSLSTLRADLRRNAKSVEEDEAVGHIAKAEKTARSGDGVTTLSHLKDAGK